MTRPRLHTIEERFSIRIEKRLNDYLSEEAKKEGMSKSLLIESILGSWVREKQKQEILTSKTALTESEPVPEPA